MLRTLDIRDMLIIDRLTLEFEAGLNVLTGETGAGKSILLDALGFVLGWRGRADLVREGAAQGEVTAVFDLSPDHPARDILAEAGLPKEDELVLRRINGRDGRKTAYVNDRRTSGEVLRQLSALLLELHGQHDERGLLNPRGHREILDRYGALDAPRGAVAKAWSARQKARKARAAAEAELAELRAEEDFLRHAVAEFDTLAPRPGEEPELDSRRRLMQSAERIRAELARAIDALGRDGAEGAASDALRWLEGAADHAEGRLDAPMEAVTRAMVELDEAARGITDCLDALAFDASDLDATEERLFAIRALARKHQVTPDALEEHGETLRARIARIDDSGQDTARLDSELRDADAAYEAAAAALSDARRAAARSLDTAVAKELAPLKMERARFLTDISPAEPGPDGQDEVSFTVATNPGAPAGPLARIASGGELSRFLLALKVCLAGDSEGKTLIFDEIDRGVGGATADAVGRRLAALGARGQVLVVTHAPQVAARASHHWRVEKRVEQDTTLSTVTPLDTAARVDELARMLAGDSITDEARAAARSLLDG
ncbi:DNA repair protein RecN [Poseidonocella sedimentorum]|uniref:DNA repair protein RecN n=1 Tax=Poseidonocella sedimentorum TaxID=871652 RepID=A0A1I6CPD0_9RHOB|nr:DNA repair protein RecN [Poseidonocella sedimentorum]SFQ95006.1 DNA replication and repair protein RecN [Poseidonocella sedimentorum]